MSKGNNAVNWFEIPVTDINRAVSFYNSVFEWGLTVQAFGPTQMAVIPIPGEGVHGALVQGEGYVPSDKGPLLYLNGGDDLSRPLGKIAKAGGKVLQPKEGIGEHGFMATFLDTEGNRLALHSMK